MPYPFELHSFLSIINDSQNSWFLLWRSNIVSCISVFVQFQQEVERVITVAELYISNYFEIILSLRGLIIPLCTQESVILFEVVKICHKRSHFDGKM